MKKLAAVLVLLVLVFLAGYWPQRGAAREAQDELASVKGTLESAQARVRAGAVLGRALTLKEAVAAQNYGTARSLSTALFDAVRDENARTSDPSIRKAYEEILAMRDPLTAALARADAAAGEIARGFEIRLRGALGYETAPATPAPETPAPQP
jgi:hypothetical protein